MNKLFKHILNIFILWLLLIPSFSSASFVCSNTFFTSNDKNWYDYFTIAWSEFADSDLFCLDNRIWDNAVWYSISCDWNYTYLKLYESVCFYKSEWINHLCVDYKQSWKWAWGYMDSNCLDFPKNSLQCQIEYNLIPVESVTKNYCEINFDLIDPSTCPITEWSWAVNWSSLFINGTQYAWNNSINMFIPNYLWRNITFNDEETNVEIEWYNVDEEYLNNIIDNEKLQPTNKDFENMLVWIVNFAPYIFICLIIYFLLSRLPKMFR